MNIRLYNARILTMEKGKDVFEGEIWVRNEKIAYVANKEEINTVVDASFPWIRWDLEIDCQRNLLMPGFKNAHTHSAMTFLRSYADDMNLQEWLNEKVFPMEKKLTYEDIYELTKLAILEYLTSGVTAIFDMYLMPEAVANACIDMGMRCVLLSGLNNFTSSVEQMEMEYNRWNNSNPLITYQMGVHAEYTCSKNLLMQVSNLVHKYRAPLYTHLSETKREVEECVARNGMTPPMFLDSMGLFDFGGGGFHCVHLTDMDMDLFRRRKLRVITCPGSNVKLGSGIAPVAKMERHKLNVAIGTDGAASNNALDMFREMYLCAGLSGLREDGDRLNAIQALRMATVHGSKAMCLKGTDILAKGKHADLIMIDLHQPNMQPIHNIPKNLVYSGSKSNVKLTMVGGKILYYNGQYNIGESPEEIYRRCQEIADRMKAG